MQFGGDRGSSTEVQSVRYKLDSTGGWHHQFAAATVLPPAHVLQIREYEQLQQGKNPRAEDQPMQ